MKRLIFSLALGFILCVNALSQGSVWQREAPDSTGTDKGEYCSLDLDNEDNPHIAYYDRDFQDLRHVYCRDGSWTIDVVDSIENAGEYCSIALDSQSRPHISYKAEILEYHEALKYATLTDAGWRIVIVDSSTFAGAECGENSSIAIGDDGYPSISYTKKYPDKIKYAFEDGSGWHIHDVKDVYGSYFTRLVFDDRNIPIIGFLETDSIQTGLNLFRAAYLNPLDSSWSIVTVPESLETSGHGTLVDFDIDSQNNLYFAYLGPDDYLRVAVYDGQSWNIETIPEDPGPYGAPGLSLKIDRADQPSVALFVYGDVYCWRKADGQWYYSLVDDAINPRWHCSLAFDGDNHPRISAHCGTLDFTHDALFYYRYWPGDPEIVLPQTFHNYGSVWTQSYSDWDCPVENNGTAPLIIDQLEFVSPWWDTTFHVVNISLPKTILPQESDVIAIRFNPFGEQTYLDTLVILSNDSLHLEEKVALQGTGIASGDVGDLFVYVKNCYAAPEYHELNENMPLPGAWVSLFQNDQLMYGPLETGQDGSAAQGSVAAGDYELKIFKKVLFPGDDPRLDTLGHIAPLEIGPGTNSKTMVVPESLMVQKYQSVYDLTHIEKTSVLGKYSYTFRYPGEDGVRDLLYSWKMDVHPQVKMSVARLFLAEQMVGQMFSSGYSAGGMVIRSISELINFIFYSDSWFDSILEIIEFILDLLTDPMSALLRVVTAFSKYELLSLMDDAIQQAAAELPCLEDPYLGEVICGEEIVMAAWRDIKGQFSAWDALLPGFSSGSWSEMEELIEKKLKNAIFQMVYVDLLTDPQIDKAKEYSENFQFYGDFRDASECVSEFIADKTDEVEGAVSVCDGLIDAANLFMTTGAVLELIGELPHPMAGFLGAIGDLLVVGAYVEVVSALGLSAYTFFTLPVDMDDAVDRIYAPDKLLRGFRKVPPPFPRAKADPHLMAMVKQNVQQSAEDFDSTVVEIKNQILSGNTEGAILRLEDLMIVENNLTNSIRVSCSPIYAVASIARDSLVSFPSMYDSLIFRYGDAGMERFKDFIYLMFLPWDTTQALKDTIVAQLDRSIRRSHILADQISATLDTVSVLSMPAIVVVKEALQDMYALTPEGIATIRIQLQNVGALDADSVSVVLRTNPAIRVHGADSLYVGTLSPGGESEVLTWTVGVSSNDYSRGTWTAEVRSSNAKSYSRSGSFETPQTPGTGGKLSNENVYCYPNPFNPLREFSTLRYSLAKTARVTITIYDAGGNLVKTLIDDELQTIGTEQSRRWDGKDGSGDIVANGVYFFVIETSQDERAVGKIAVLR